MALAIFFAAFFPALYFVAKNTDSYLEAEHFVRNDQTVRDAVGKVNAVDFAFWRGFEFSAYDGNGHADFSFYVAGDNANGIVMVRLRSIKDSWSVDDVSIEAARR